MFAGLLAVAEPARAQTAITLVSNLGQGDDADIRTSSDVAMQFTTGSNAFGYTLTSVDIGSDDAEGDSFSASVCTVDSDGYPTTSCTDLTAPGSFAAGVLSFTAPANTVLAAETKYAVVIDPDGTVTFDQTYSDGEDAGKAEGWSIADVFFWLDGSTWKTSAGPRQEEIRIAVKGYANVCEPTNIWCANLTVGQVSDPAGYCRPASGRCSSTQQYGSLSDDDFFLDGRGYTVESLRWGGTNNLHLTLDKDFPASLLAGLTLKVGTHEFALSEARRGNDQNTVANNYRWNDPPSAIANAEVGDVLLVQLLLAGDADATLKAIELEDASDGSSIEVGAFSARHPDTYAYVQNRVTMVTVEARATQSGASVEYLTESGSTLADADTKAGHQWSLNVGWTRMKFRVTAADGVTKKTYSLRVHRTGQVATSALVSTTGQRTAGAVRVGNRHHGSPSSAPLWAHAQRFTTGDHSDGYTVQSIVVSMGGWGSSATPRVNIHADSSGVPHPNSLFAVLTNPPRTTDGNATFTAPSGSTLAANTDYWVLFHNGNEAVGSENLYSVSVTSLGHPLVGLDPGAASGWDIADQMLTSSDRGDWEIHPTLRTHSVQIAVVGTENTSRRSTPPPLTAEFTDLPSAHDGTEFSFTLEFSEDIPDLNPKTLRDASLQATGGTFRTVDRQTSGSNRDWTVYVVPAGTDPVTVTLPETTDCGASGAVCTPDGRKLSNSTTATVAASPALSVSDASATEGEAVEFTVSLSAAADEQVTVAYATSGGTATEGEDFTAASGTLTFAANETSKTVSVATTDDEADEDDETFTLTLSSPANATLAVAEATGTINDDDATPLTASFSDMPESHTGAEFTFTLTFSEDFEGLGYMTLRDTAFTVAGGSVKRALRQTEGNNQTWTIAVEPTSANFSVKITLPETTDCDASGAICTPDGRKLSNSTTATVEAGAPGSPPTLSVSDASATEGEAVDFAVSLSAAANVQVTVAYATSGGTAIEGEDFTAASGTLTFAANETSKTVSVATTDDAADEDDETFTLTLSSPANATLGDLTAIGTIEDDDEAPLTGFTLVDATSHTDIGALTDGASFTFEDPANGSYGIRAEPATDAEIGSVRLALSGAKTVSRTENIAPYSLYGDDGTNVAGEGLPAGSYTLTAAAYSEAGLGGRELGTLAVSFTVVAAELPALSVSDASATEGEAVEFTVSLSAAANVQVTVQYATSGGTATEGEDFTAASGTLTFAANETSKTVSVATTDDSADEDDETFTLTLSSPANATLGDATATGTINDNDVAATPPALSVSDASATEGDAVDFTVSLSAAANVQVTVAYATSGGTAIEGEDFTAASGTLTFEANETSKTVSVATTDDEADEDDETFTLTLSSPANATLADAAATGTIIDDDEAPPPLTGFMLVDAATATDIGAIADGASFELADPANGSYGIRAEPATGAEIGSVGLALSGAKTASRTENIAPYSLYGDDGTNVYGEDLPAGSYTLTATAYAEARLGGRELGALEVSFTVVAAPALTASFNDVPASHTGAEFTFTLTFSENIEGLSFRTLRDTAFTVAGGSVKRAQRKTQGSNQAWTITVEPTSANFSVKITLPETTDCSASGAICTRDGRKLSNSTTATVAAAASASAGDAATTDVVMEDALALLDGVSPDEAARALLGEGGLSEAQLGALDRLGNGNGGYDLGDLLAWRDRCRRGEAECGRTSTGSRPASSAALLAAGAAGRRARSRRPRRRGSGRRRAPMAGTALVLLLAVLTVWSCTDGSAGPTAPAAAAPDRGFLAVEWTAPAAGRDIGVLLELEGPGIEALRAPGYELYESASSERHQIVVAGSLRSGPLVHFEVPDRNQLPMYRVRVLQVTGEDYGLGDPTEYRAVITPG